MSPLRTTNAYEALLFNQGLIHKVFMCASTLMSHAQNERLAEILSRTDDGYPERIINDFEYLYYEVASSLSNHAQYMGSRICQDWSGTEETSPTFLFSKQERDILSRVYEQYNSNMQDYDPEFDSFGDEMVISFVIATALRVIALFNKNTTRPTLSLKDAVNFAVEMLPDVIHDDSDLFNFAIKQIQNALGQDAGDNAGMYFSDDAIFEKWKEQSQDERKDALMQYVRFELTHMSE